MTPNETSCNNPKWSCDNDVINDEKRFETFFREHFLKYCLYCQYRFGFGIDDAKEVVHLGFIKLWERRQTIERQHSVTSYLQKIIHNNCLDVLKHEKVKLKYRNTLINRPDHDDNIYAFTRLDLEQMEANIRNAIAELPPQMRKIFEKSRFDGLSYAEIARQMDISKKTVETQVGRALTKLKQKLEHYIKPGLLLLLCIKKIIIFFYL